MEIEVHTDNILNRLKYSDEDVSIYANGSECQQYRPRNTLQHSRQSKEDSKIRSNPTGYIICYAISICAAIISTGFISHTILKPHYDGCLTISGLPDLPPKRLRPPRDCNGHFSNGALEDGVYRIYPEMTEPFHVYCDMSNGGWTVIQRRTSGVEDFDRTWTDYVRGFGNLTQDHWLGLQHLHLITRQERGYQVSFEFLLKDSDVMVRAVYENFYIGDERTNFTLRVSFSDGYNTEMRKRIDDKNLFLYHDLAPFSTKDVDNDFMKKSSCVEEMECGGFWYTDCTMLCLNGDFNGMFFFGRAYKPVFIKTSVIKIPSFCVTLYNCIIVFRKQPKSSSIGVMTAMRCFWIFENINKIYDAQLNAGMADSASTQFEDMYTIVGCYNKGRQVNSDVRIYFLQQRKK